MKNWQTRKHTLEYTDKIDTMPLRCLLMAQSTTQNTDVSPLFRLPVELRDKIQAFAYGSMKIHVYSNSAQKSCGNRNSGSTGGCLTRPPTMRYIICMNNVVPGSIKTAMSTRILCPVRYAPT